MNEMTFYLLLAVAVLASLGGLVTLLLGGGAIYQWLSRGKEWLRLVWRGGIAFGLLLIGVVVAAAALSWQTLSPERITPLTVKMVKMESGKLSENMVVASVLEKIDPSSRQQLLKFAENGTIARFLLIITMGGLLLAFVGAVALTFGALVMLVNVSSIDFDGADPRPESESDVPLKEFRDDAIKTSMEAFGFAFFTAIGVGILLRVILESYVNISQFAN